jgi:4-hydroxybenzoate polyprenyltransferase
MIKWDHTIFALPFAMLSLLVASDGKPGWTVLVWVLVAMVGARSTAMAFNRLVDASIDGRNPRTTDREIPAGKLGRGPVILFTVVTALMLVVAAWQLNPLCLALSPVALFVVYFYSLTKRFTAFSQVFLGLGLGIAPVGAWLAYRGSFDLFPLLLGGAVLCWVAGFDTLYACQDIDFDRQVGLHSLPAWLGASRARWVSRGLHAGAIVLWVLAGRATLELGSVYFIAVALVALLLLYEQWLVRGGDLRRIDRAFFEVNSWVGVVLLTVSMVDLYWV